MTLRLLEHLLRGCRFRLRLQLQLQLQLRLRLRFCACLVPRRLRQTLPGHGNRLAATLHVPPVAMLVQCLSSV